MLESTTKLRAALLWALAPAFILANSSCGSDSPTAPQVKLLTIAPDTVRLVVGGTAHLSATARDASGHVITGQTVTWSSASPGIASVATDGTISAHIFGLTTITAKSGALQDSAVAQVADSGTMGVSGGVVTADSGRVVITVPQGALSAPIQVSVAPALGAPSDARLLGAAVVEVGPHGTTFRSPVTVALSYRNATLPNGTGPANLTLYSAETNHWTLLGASSVDTSAKTVSATTSQFSFFGVGIIPPPSSVNVVAPASTVTVGDSLALGAVVLDAFGDTLARPPVIWQTTDSTVARVNATGVVTGVAVGAARITASSGSVSGSVNIATTLDVSPTGSWMQVTNGAQSACALSKARAAFCWGRDNVGELGNGVAPGFNSVLSYNTPQAVLGGHAFTTLSASTDHVCGQATDGSALCWGNNGLGMSGADTSAHFLGSPAAVALTSAFTDITAGSDESCALGTDKHIQCWGYLAWYVDSNATNPQRPSVVAGDSAFAALTEAFYQICAIGLHGDAYCWGRNDGQLGNGQTSSGITPVFAPQLVAGGHKFAKIATYRETTCGLTVDGDVYCWGDDSHGQIGDGSSPDLTMRLPARVATTSQFVDIALNFSHACAVTKAGRAYCWGTDDHDQLGVDSTSVPVCNASVGPFRCSTTPVAVAGNHILATISNSNYSSCGLSPSGVIYCWGDNTYGQLGDGTTTGRFTPAPILLPPGVSASSDNVPVTVRAARTALHQGGKP